MMVIQTLRFIWNVLITILCFPFSVVDETLGNYVEQNYGIHWNRIDELSVEELKKRVREGKPRSTAPRQTVAPSPPTPTPTSTSTSTNASLPESPHLTKLDKPKVVRRLTAQKVVHPKDNVTRFVIYLSHGHFVDATTLRRLLPKTVQQLEQGTIDPTKLYEAVATQIYNVLYPTLEQYLGKSVEKMLENRRQLVIDLAGGMAQLALNHVYALKNYDTEMEEPTQRLICAFINNLKRLSIEFHNTDRAYDATPFHSVHFYKSATDETIQKFAHDLDRAFYNGEKGGFWNHCPIRTKQHQDYLRYANILFQGTTIAKAIDTQVAAIRLKESLKFNIDSIAFTHADNSHQRCWECHKICLPSSSNDNDPKALLPCNHCRVANYCSVECQRAAWISGHKECCRCLVDANEHFQENVNLIQLVHSGSSSEEAKKALEGFPSNCNEELDYAVLETMLSTPKEEWIVTDDKPSMKNFYRNLQQLNNERFWIFQQDYKNSTEEAKAMLQYQANNIYSGVTGQGALQAEKDHFQQLAMVLCFDIAKVAEKKLKLRSDDINNTKGWNKIGEALGLADMPLQRFLALYNAEPFVPLSDNSDPQRDMLRLRRMRTASAYAQLRNHYHKK